MIIQNQTHFTYTLFLHATILQWPQVESKDEQRIRKFVAFGMWTISDNGGMPMKYGGEWTHVSYSCKVQSNIGVVLS